jgi:hypothetical protein
MIQWLEAVEIGEFWDVPGCFLILFMIAAADLTGHRVPSPKAIWVIISIFLSFSVF